MITSNTTIEDFITYEIKDAEGRLFIPHAFRTNTKSLKETDFSNVDVPVGAFDKYISLSFSVSDENQWVSFCLTEFLFDDQKIVLDFETFFEGKTILDCIYKSLKYMDDGIKSVTPHGQEINLTTYKEVSYVFEDFLNLIIKWKMEN